MVSAHLVMPAPQVFLGEVNSGISSTQVVVKELKASASVQEQMQFLEEAQPYRWVALGTGSAGGAGALPGRWGRRPCRQRRALCPAEPAPSPPHPLPALSASQGWLVGSRRALQHCNLLQCLAQCAEVTPYLLVMEFCPMVSSPLPPVPALRFWNMGLASCRGALAEPGTPQPHPVGLTSPSKWAQVALHHCLPEVAWGRREVTPPPQRQRLSGLGLHGARGGGGGSCVPGLPLLLGVMAIFPRGTRPVLEAQSPHVWSSLTHTLVSGRD